MTNVTKAGLARDVWQEMMGYFFAHRERMLDVVQQLGLTPGHMKTLFELDGAVGCSMGELAEAMACDASNATWLVDRLEERGLVERQPHPRDRRVKTVVLTPAGVATKKLLVDKMSEPPDDLVALGRSELEALHNAVALLPGHPPFWEPPARSRPAQAGN